MRRIPVYYSAILNSVSATTISSAIDVSDFRNAVIAIGGGPTAANFKVFIKGGVGKRITDSSCPIRFGNPKVINNKWDFIDVVDLEDGASIDGDTGIAFTVPDVRLVEINVNALDWIAVNCSAYVAGSCSVDVTLVTNE